MTRSSLLALALLVASAPNAVAQAPVDSAPLVRLSTPTIPDRTSVVGRLVASKPDVITVRTSTGEVVEVPRTMVRRYEVSRGRAPQGPAARKAAFVGIVLGAVVGAATTPDHAEGESSKAAQFTIGGALIGGIVGWAFGTFNRPLRWERTDPPPPTP